MIIKFHLYTELGKFDSENIQVSPEQYKNLINLTKNYYTQGYEMFLPDGFLVATPEVVKKSILTIEIIENELQK